MTDAPRLLLGPLLRHVDRTSATVWVETDRPCTVRVEAGAASASEATWSVHGHHFAILVVQGLEPGTTTPYAVTLDGAPAWPSPDPELAALPRSVVRTERADGSLRLAFGSCRRSEPLDAEGNAAVGADALVAMADRMRSDPHAPWPDLLLMVGDQLYADEPSVDVRRRLETARRGAAESGEGAEDVREEICTFEEYTWLYSESWSQPPVRWLLSTVPTCMLLDDHDLRDDWNTSAAWREEVSRRPWFPDRVKGALGSYWVYQHLGNLAPADLAADPLLRAVREAPDEAARDALVDAFALRADAEPDSARWSYTRDLGDPASAVRLLAVDCRCSRRLDPDDRAILDDAEWRWVQERATTPPEGGRVEHLLLASTLPVLMLPGFSDVESWNEALVAGHWGRWLSGPAERFRRAVDMEHWPAFRASLDGLLDLLGRVAGAPRPPASILLLGGDVHCSYTARAQLDGVDHPGTAVHQLVMSPFRNPLKPALRWANRAVQRRPVRALCRALAASAGVPRPAARWEVDAGPWFDNGVMTVVVDGPRVRVEVDHVRVGADGEVLRRTTVRDLTA